MRIRSSKEFSYESFEEAINYAHTRNKKVYVTINGFPFNNQLKLMEEHIEKMAEMKPDAFIVSTPGVIRLAKKTAPQIPIHLSTQANVMNYLDAEVYHDMGVSRIIAAREVSLKDLENIKKRLPDLELEVFVHGSMCFAYSGRCLISSLQSGRVPNRGSCANDCRFPYTLYAENEETGVLMKIEQDEAGTHIMNAKDLNLSSHIDEILQSGVIDSLKIEGRTKSPYYAAITAKTYRKAVDDFYAGNFTPELYEQELATTKHRGFSEGYIINRPFEKEHTQNLETSISDGIAQVYGMVMEDEMHFLAKDKVEPGMTFELILPPKQSINEIDNETGTIFYKDDKPFITLKTIETKKGKILEAVHSGNENPIKLPCSLPAFTMFRQ